MLYNVSTHHFSLLLGHMLINEKFCRECATSIESDWFTQPDIGGTYFHSLAFTTICQYFNDFKVPPDAGAFQVGVFSIAERFINQMDLMYQQFQHEVSVFVTQFMPTVNHTSAPLAREVKKYLVNKCRFDAEIHGLVGNLTVMANSNQMSSAELEQIAHKLNDVQKRRAAESDGVSQSGIMAAMVTEPRTQTGIPFFDARFGQGKGPTTSSVMGVIAGQGSGKTTLGNQIAVQQALMGRPSLIVIAEQGWDADYRRNVWACATGIPTPTIQACNDNIREAAVVAGVDVDSVMHRLELVDKNLRWVDLIELDGNVEAFEDEVLRLAESSTDQKLQVVYVDWASAIANMMVSRGYRGRSFQNNYEALFVLGQQITDLATRSKTFMAISQQMSAEAASWSPYRDRGLYCGLDNKMFTAQFRYCCIINPPCLKTKLQLMEVPKARNDSRYIGDTRWVVRLNGPCARFEEASDYMYKPGRIVSRKHQGGAGNAVPKE